MDDKWLSHFQVSTETMPFKYICFTYITAKQKNVYFFSISYMHYMFFVTIIISFQKFNMTCHCLLHGAQRIICKKCVLTIEVSYTIWSNFGKCQVHLSSMKIIEKHYPSLQFLPYFDFQNMKKALLSTITTLGHAHYKRMGSFKYSPSSNVF